MALNNDWQDDAYEREIGLSVLALSLLKDPANLTFDSAALTWRVDNWSSIAGSVRSPKFFCGGIEWRLLLFPTGNPDVDGSSGHVSLYIDRSNFGRATTATLPPVCVMFSFVVSNPYDIDNHITWQTTRRIPQGTSDWGFSRLCPNRDITEVRHGETAAILQGNQLDITVSLRVMNDPNGDLWENGVPDELSTRPLLAPSTSVFQTPSPRFQQPTRRAISSFEPQTSPSPPSPKKEIPTRPAKKGEECLVCRDEPSTFPLKPPTPLCLHETNVCEECLQTLIKSEVDNKGIIDSIACPSPKCKEQLFYEDIKNWADNHTFARYDLLLVKRSMGVDESYVSCKNPSCDAGQIHEQGAEEPIVTCYNCGAKSCFNHQMPWHEGFLCKEWDDEMKLRNDPNIKTTKQYMAKFTKPCPQCKRPIEKAYGCDHMACTQCKHNFCWLCIAPYEPILDEGNHRHKPECKYYTAYDAAAPVIPPALRAKRLWYKPWQKRYV